MSSLLVLGAVILFTAAAFFNAPTWAEPFGLALFAASFLVGPAVDLNARYGTGRKR